MSLSFFALSLMESNRGTAKYFTSRLTVSISTRPPQQARAQGDALNLWPNIHKNLHKYAHPLERLLHTAFCNAFKISEKSLAKNCEQDMCSR